MIIYLDNCSLNRPFDNQKQRRIYQETEAKLYLQDLIQFGNIELAWSYMIDFENSFNPFEYRKQFITNWKKYSKYYTVANNEIITKAKTFIQLGFNSKDSLHLACSIYLKSDYFVTTDDLLIKKEELIN